MYERERQSPIPVGAALAALAMLGIAGFLVYSTLLRHREKNHEPSCLANLRQLTAAVQEYANDWDARVPFVRADGTAGAGAGEWGPDRYWMDALYPYIRNKYIFRCHEDPDHDIGYAWNVMAFGDRGSVSIGGTTDKRGRSLNDVDDPYGCICAGDNPDAYGDSASSPPVFKHPSRVAPTYVCLRHYGGGSYGFADGHAKWCRGADIVKLHTARGNTPDDPMDPVPRAGSSVP